MKKAQIPYSYVWSGLGFGLLCLLILSVPTSCKGPAGNLDSLNTLGALNKAILDDPSNDSLYAQRARVHVSKNDIPAAVADWQRAIRIDSLQASYYLELGDLYFTHNETRKAKETLEKGTSLIPDDTDLLIKLGELLYYVKMYEASLSTIDKVLEQDPNLAKAYFLKGMIFKESGDTLKAISSMQTAAEQDPEYYVAYMQLGLLHAAKGNSLALDYYDNAIRLNNSSLEAYYGKAKFLQDQGNVAEAEKVYGEILSMDPAFKYAHYNLGAMALSARKYDPAIAHFTKAIESDARYKEAYYARAVCFESIGDMRSAVKDYRASLDIDPGYVSSLEALRAITSGK